MCASWLCSFKYNFCHSRPQRPRSFWSTPRIATSGRVQRRKSVIHGLPVTLRMLWVKSDKSDWFWSHSIVCTNPFKTGMSLDLARGRDSWCWPKGARPLGTRMNLCHKRQLAKWNHSFTVHCTFLSITSTTTCFTFWIFFALTFQTTLPLDQGFLTRSFKPCLCYLRRS